MEWNNEREQAFQLLKSACIDTPVLAYANYKKPFCLNTDTSKTGLGAVLYQQQDDGTFRVISYVSRSLSKTERNYDAHKLDFLALKWSVTEQFHEYLYGGSFEVFTDNNPLTYVLTTAKLDATGQRWVAILANYNFKIFYKAGKLNLDADALSQIPWEMSETTHTPLDTILAKSLLLTPALAVKLPFLPNAMIQSRELIMRNDLELTKKQWKQEQSLDYSIKSVVDLLQNGNLLTYNCQKTDPDDMKCMLRLRKEFFLSDDLLYRKAHFKNANKIVNQFVMPCQF